MEVRTADFEKASLPAGAFDLLVSATAFHWLDPAIAYPRAAARSLRAGGSIALFRNEHASTDADRGFFATAQDVYAREAPETSDGHRGGPPRPGDLPGRGEEVVLGEESRARLHDGISRLIREEYGGRIVKGYATSLYVARRK